MKVLLINPIIREWLTPTAPPIGLGYIAAVLRKNGIDVEIYDVNARRYTDEKVFDDLTKKDFDVVGIGGQITVYREVKRYCDHLKKVKPNIPIIIGGTVADSIPEVTLTKIKADVIIIGEAEDTFLELCKKIEEGKKFRDVQGVAFLKDGKVVFTPPRKGIENLGEIPFPAYDLFDMDIYLKNQENTNGRYKHTFSISTVRGCIYACTFCCKSFRQYNYRTRPIDDVLTELKMLDEKYGVDFVYISDDLFVFAKERVLEFCKKYKEWGFTQPWLCNARVNVVDDEILRAMKDAGCVNIAYGVESASPKILRVMKKMINVESAKNTIKLTRKHGIFPTLNFIVGMPKETEETIQETVDFCKDLGIPATFFYVNPYPGTPLFEEYKEKIIEKYGNLENYVEKLLDITDFVINLTDMSDEDFVKAKTKAERDLRRYVYMRPHILFRQLKEYYQLVGGVRPVLDMVKRKIYLSIKKQTIS